MKQSTISLRRSVIFGLLIVAFIPLTFLGISSYLTNLSIIQQFQKEQQINYAKSTLNLTNEFLYANEKKITLLANQLKILPVSKIDSYLSKHFIEENNDDDIVVVNDKNVFSSKTLAKEKQSWLMKNFKKNQDLLDKQKFTIQKSPWQSLHQPMFVMSTKVRLQDQNERLIQLFFSTANLEKHVEALNSELVDKKAIYLTSGESLFDQQAPKEKEMGLINQIATYHQSSGTIKGNKNDNFASMYYQKSNTYPFFVMAYTNKQVIRSMLSQKISQLLIMMSLSLLLTIILAWFIAKIFEDSLNKIKATFLEASHGQFELITTEKKRFNFWEIFRRQLRINEQVYEIREVSSAYHYMLAEFACFHSDITKQIDILNQRFANSQKLYYEINDAVDALLYQAFQDKTILNQQSLLVKIDNQSKDELTKELIIQKQILDEMQQNQVDLVKKIEFLQLIKDSYTKEMTTIYESFVRMYISLNEFNDHQLTN
ncbi:hypothetical protein [Enterococcus columbae]|uniref:Uncharacterized protein n=1 Tax=Enterococcus columbae DSM 7374 = ATCC 51263 TaxID=1121865 RepID=S1NSY8_9ENTE|nr:hypothetical protein [Enterococcus columbae]EOT40014.1 hypothetical protein OMW_01803 [Enterococcus columbae DSM 7374 = ATCC 51263]EOW83999.1 hypothetical protein I568_01446 [Enterococcus columbae DSM 7374 = ATCC 51263]OJG25782.1 hypothetical protein RR47_GL001288 [Enterococcus columbae DSM 7374 = ATCC 51263]